MNIQIFDANKLTMSSLEIAELTGKEHRNVMADIRKMFEELGQAAADFSATAFYQVNNATREREIFNLPKRESLILVSGYSAVLRARIIDRWQELESQQVAQKQQTTPAMLSPIETHLRAIAIIGQSMRMSDSGVLMMYHSYCKANAPEVAAVLPPYAIDAPTGKESEGSKSHAAIKDICQGIMSAVKANKALMKAGLLEQLERPSTSAPNGIKTYKSVTAKGLKYGLNVTSQENTRETQPHWYHETADELIEIIKANGV